HGHFRPEFLNRVDDIIIFNQLRREDIASILDIQFEHVLKRLAQKEIDCSLTPEAKRVLADNGYDPVFGARPLKRAIQRLILDPLAEKLIAGEIKKGSSVTIDAKGNELTFTLV
ncbi:MAG TPA: ATP-dependent chaperone ClpB, partial [Myxococcales bacterium]|nr:ATP-dependent chaperone ClpB [Myxococcales bacterium]